MFDDQKVCVIIPAYNEEQSIADVIADFQGNKYIDEILVVDNKSEDDTARIAREHSASVVFEEKRGYGNALKCGMNTARGNILILVEADVSFRSADADKILESLRENDIVFGSRTERMTGFVRWGNIMLAKLVNLLWHSDVRFTDVGCTYRGLWKKSYEKMKERLRSPGPEFSVEMMIEALHSGLKIAEVPVGYHERAAGESKHSHIKTGFRMLGLIFRKKLKVS